MFPFDQHNQQTYQQYAQAWDSGQYNNIDQAQAAGHVQQFVQQAPPQMQMQAFEQFFSQLSPQQRQQFIQHVEQQTGAPPTMDPQNPQQMAQSFQQMGKQQPDMLHQLFSSGGALGNPIAKMAVAGIAAYAAKQILGAHH